MKSNLTLIAVKNSRLFESFQAFLLDSLLLCSFDLSDQLLLPLLLELLLE